MVRCDGERGVKPPGLPEHSRLEPRDAECPADLCPFGFRKEFDTTAALGPQEPSRRQEMVLPSSCLGLGPRTSSSPSSSDSTICCNWNHYTTRLRNRLQKVKPKDRDVPGPPAPPRRAAPAAAPAPTATPSSQPPRRGLETTASRAPRRHHTPSSPSSFSGFSLSFPLLSSFLCPLLSRLGTRDPVPSSPRLNLHYKSFALVWGPGRPESPSACVSQVCVSPLPSVPAPLAGGAAPPPPPSVILGVTGGGRVCGALPPPRLVWKLQTPGATSSIALSVRLACVPPLQGFPRSPGHQ